MAPKRVYIKGEHPIRNAVSEQYICHGVKVYDWPQNTVELLEFQNCSEWVILTPDTTADKMHVDMDTIQLLKSLVELVKDKVDSRPIVHVLFQCNLIMDLFLKYDSLSYIEKHLDLYPFTLEGMWAKNVLVGLPGITSSAYPPLDRRPITAESKDRIHLVLYGWDGYAEELALHTALIAHFPNYRSNDEIPIRTRITVLDEDIIRKRDLFVARYQSLFDHSFYRTISLADKRIFSFHQPAYEGKRKDFVDVEWEFVEGSVTDVLFRNKLVTWAKDEDRQLTIALSHGDDEENLKHGLSLPNEVYDSKIPVLVRMSRKCDADVWMTDDHPQCIYPFGMCDCGYNVTLPLIRMAKLLKYFYDCSYGNQGIPTVFSMEEVEKSWSQESSLRMRFSNIYNVMTIPTKMHSLGHDRMDVEAYYALNRQEIELLAETEHNRWSVERLIQGDRPCTEEERLLIRKNIQQILEARNQNRELPEDMKKKYKRENHIHYDLCAYDELEMDATGKNVQTYDYDLTAAIPLIYKTYMEHRGDEDRIG